MEEKEKGAMPPRESSISELIAKQNTEVLEDHPAINAREARTNFSRIVQAARYKNSRVIITDHGEPAAALVPITDVKVLDLIDSLNIQQRLEGLVVKDLTVEELKRIILGEDAQEVSHESGGEDHP